MFLADYFEKLTLVEHNRDALVFAEQNLAGIKHESFGLSGAKWAESNKDSYFDAVVIDPPRSGMELEVRKYLCSSKIPQIRSVSCDPATLARDIKLLGEMGYEFVEATPCDMFPHTAHVEVVSLLQKVK